MAVRSLALLLAFLAVVLAAGDSAWCGPDTNLCSTTNSILTNLACGWCRSWTFGSSIVGDTLLLFGLDGGALPGDGNSTHNYLVSASLASAFALSDSTHWQLNILPTAVPEFKDLVLFADRQNETLYLFGGRTLGAGPPSAQIQQLALDDGDDAWSTPVSSFTVGRRDGGVAVDVLALQAGFYVGGYESSQTSSDVTDDLQHYEDSMIVFNTSTGTPALLSAPFLPAQYGGVTFLPYGSRGILVYFGGESPASAAVANCSNCTSNPWDHAWIYDIALDKWYRQSTADYPSPRLEFCTATVHDAATNSWQIWVFGGVNFASDNVLDSTLILSIPSFQWFSAPSSVVRMSTSCETFGSQVFIIGGRTANTGTGGSNYADIAVLYDLNAQVVTASYDPTKTAYTAPSSIRDAIATASTPAVWADASVQALFAASPTATAPASTGSTASESPPAAGMHSSLSTGAVAGIVISALAAFAFAAFLLLRKRRRRTGQLSADASHPWNSGPAELPHASHPTDSGLAELPNAYKVPLLHEYAMDDLRADATPAELDAHEKRLAELTAYTAYNQRAELAGCALPVELDWRHSAVSGRDRKRQRA